MSFQPSDSSFFIPLGDTGAVPTIVAKCLHDFLEAAKIGMGASEKVAMNGRGSGELTSDEQLSAREKAPKLYLCFKYPPMP
jgi:hypothetical protein